jgi:hypothetical protein
MSSSPLSQLELAMLSPRMVRVVPHFSAVYSGRCSIWSLRIPTVSGRQFLLSLRDGMYASYSMLETFDRQICDCRTNDQVINTFTQARSAAGISRLTPSSTTDLVPVWCNGRIMHVRRIILDYCPQHLWSDEYFATLVSVNKISLMELHERRYQSN